MIQNRICKSCGRSFQGGPRAYYCPSCREERVRAQGREFKRRKKIGDIRPLGSLDKCEKCGKDYEVISGLQRFCSDCQIAHKLDYDASRAMPKYEANKERLNPLRNERRRYGKRNCDWCGNEYTVSVGVSLTCSDECREALYKKKWKENNKKAWKKIKASKSRKERDRARKERIRQERLAAGLCPQCGGEWIDPIVKRNHKPKHCRICQEYYRNRRKSND